MLYVSLPKRPHPYPSCAEMTSKIHDYRMQKIKHLKWFERLTIIFYKRACGKRFSEGAPFVRKYQSYTKEWNQVVRVHAV